VPKGWHFRITVLDTEKGHARLGSGWKRKERIILKENNKNKQQKKQRLGKNFKLKR
jgi:hypothetical protein